MSAATNQQTADAFSGISFCEKNDNTISNIIIGDYDSASNETNVTKMLMQRFCVTHCTDWLLKTYSLTCVRNV